MRFGDVEAVVVNTKRRAPGQMLGMGDAASTVTAFVDTLTGGEASKVTTDLDTLALEGKILVVGGILAGLAGLWSLYAGARR